MFKVIIALFTRQHKPDPARVLMRQYWREVEADARRLQLALAYVEA